MTRKLTISEARTSFTKLPARFGRKPEAIEVTRRGKPVMAVLPWELYDSLTETLEILADEGAFRDLKRRPKEATTGKSYTTREASAKLEL